MSAITDEKIEQKTAVSEGTVECNGRQMLENSQRTDLFPLILFLVAVLLVMFALQGIGKRNNIDDRTKISSNSHLRVMISFVECQEYRPSMNSTSSKIRNDLLNKTKCRHS